MTFFITIKQFYHLAFYFTRLRTGDWHLVIRSLWSNGWWWCWWCRCKSWRFCCVRSVNFNERQSKFDFCIEFLDASHFYKVPFFIDHVGHQSFFWEASYAIWFLHRLAFGDYHKWCCFQNCLNERNISMYSVDSNTKLTLYSSIDHPFLPTDTSINADFSFPISMPAIFVGCLSFKTTYAESMPTFLHFHFSFKLTRRFEAG